MEIISEETVNGVSVTRVRYTAEEKDAMAKAAKERKAKMEAERTAKEATK